MTPEQAVDAIYGRLKEEWALHQESAPVPIVWDDMPAPEQAKATPWVRAKASHASGGQLTFGEAGSRRFGREGTVMVQVFAPATGFGVTTAGRLAKIALDAFEGKSAGEVWFRNARLRDLPAEGPWARVNVLADFAYDEVK